MPDTTQSTQQTKGTGNGADHRGIGERVGQINQNAQEIWSEAQGAVQQLKETLDLQGRVDRHPYGMVLAALGVGYLLGGGLFSGLTGRLVRMGLRAAALPIVKEELLNLAKSALSGAAGAQEQGTQGAQGAQATPAEPPKTV